jgi:hypothetical protein
MVLITPYDRATSLLHNLREIPLVWFLIGCVLARIGLFPISTKSPQDRYILLRRIAFGAGLFVLCMYVLLTISSLHSFVMWEDEANILSISAAGIHGLSMYNPPHSPDSTYSLMYGPFTFLVYRLALIAGGVRHFWIIRFFVVTANLSLCAALYGLVRKFVSTSTAIALLTLPLSVLLQHTEISLGLRSDIWIFLAATLAIICSLLETELAAVILVGLMGGLLVGFKITAGPAILFPLLLLYRRFGLRAIVTSSLIATAVTLLPFALPDISLRNYISWLLFTRSEIISPFSVMENVAFALFLISPCVLMEVSLNRFGVRFRKRLPELIVIFVCMILALLTSKSGSGLHYLWHIVPSITAYLALVSRDMENAPIGEQIIPLYYIAVACTLFACMNLPRAWQNIRASLMPAGVRVAQQSIDQYLDFYRHRSSLQIGSGSIPGDYRADLRYIPIYRGQPYTIEGNTGRFETGLLPFPGNVLERMKSCKDDVWLIPHSQKPFYVWVLPDSLRTTFLQNYSIDGSDGVYDAWVCNHARSD